MYVCLFFLFPTATKNAIKSFFKGRKYIGEGQETVNKILKVKIVEVWSYRHAFIFALYSTKANDFE